MRKSVLILALMSAAGTTAAQMATPSSVNLVTITPLSDGSAIATTPAIAPRPVAPSVTVNLLSMGSGIVNSVTTPGVTAPLIATNPPMATGVGSEAQARARIERDGYTNVTGVTKGPDGIWRGTAMRGPASVQLMVDARGNVSTQ